MRNLSQVGGLHKFDSFCDIGLGAKLIRTPLPDGVNKATDIFHLVHCDSWALYTVARDRVHDIFLLLLMMVEVEVLWIYLLKEKSENFHLLVSFH